MLNPKIEAIAREQIRIEFEEREGSLGREIRAASRTSRTAFCVTRVLTHTIWRL
jgi:hypothetical protein